MSDQFCVIDVETTGLYKTDRIVELAIVVLDGITMEIVDEYDTLVNPMRDVGPTHRHGITASMVSAAPTFEDVAGTVARIIEGATFVAHNLMFDERFLVNEFERHDIAMDPGLGVCTLRLSGGRLEQVCQGFGIELENAHQALADARATAALLRHVFSREDSGALAGVRFNSPHPQVRPRTLRRGQVGGVPLPVRTSPFRTRFPTSDEAALSYLHVLDQYVSDGVLDDNERAALDALARVCGISDRVQTLHGYYIGAVAAAAMRDNMISEGERSLLENLTALLGTDPALIPPTTVVERVPASLAVGTKVCFTGEAIFDGETFGRDELEALAARHGLVPVSSVTRKACNLLVCADLATASGKAKKARDYGIAMMSIEEFLRAFHEKTWGGAS